MKIFSHIRCLRLFGAPADHSVPSFLPIFRLLFPPSLFHYFLALIFLFLFLSFPISSSRSFVWLICPFMPFFFLLSPFLPHFLGSSSFCCFSFLYIFFVHPPLHSRLLSFIFILFFSDGPKPVTFLHGC
jgi:hypothetical protein